MGMAVGVWQRVAGVAEEPANHAKTSLKAGLASFKRKGQIFGWILKP
jgi:hypothetical protein